MRDSKGWLSTQADDSSLKSLVLEARVSGALSQQKLHLGLTVYQEPRTSNCLKGGQGSRIVICDTLSL